MSKNRLKVLSIIRNRRTVRRFSRKSVSVGIIRTLIDAARWAPCPNNLQPWRFYVSHRNSVITNKVIGYLEQKSKKKNIGISIFLKDAIQILKSSSSIIYVFNTRGLAKKYKILGRYYQAKANLFENQAISAAIQNLLLCAEEFNLGAVWLGSPLFLSKGIEHIFSTEYELSAIISVGYYSKKPKKTFRLPVSEILRVI